MRVGIVGMGYVGLPLAVAFAEAGHSVVAMDADPRKIAMLEAGESYIEDVSADDLRAVRDRLEPTTRIGPLGPTEAVLVCVQTPLTTNREPQLGPLMDAAGSLSRVLRAGQLVVLESTTYPGTTRERLAPILEESGLAAGSDFSLAYSPERVDPGSPGRTIRNTPKVVGGLTEVCTQRAVELYGTICDEIVPVSSPESAELTKLLENIFRSVNIALVNELAILADRMGIDIWEVVDAAATKPFGFMRFDPGPGMGGHCLPVDPFYLSWRAREFDVPTEFIELAGKVNVHMPYFCVEKIERALNDAGKAVRGARVAIVGVAYKGGIGDTRESPALKILALLAERGADLVYHDPHVPELPHGMRSLPLEEALDDADLAVIVTAHPEVDLATVVRRAARVLDLRGVTRRTPSPSVERL
jgi:UDP-N-acetyl-D-glucosamine dehydrogenase